MTVTHVTFPTPSSDHPSGIFTDRIPHGVTGLAAPPYRRPETLLLCQTGPYSPSSCLSFVLEVGFTSRRLQRQPAALHVLPFPRADLCAAVVLLAPGREWDDSPLPPLNYELALALSPGVQRPPKVPFYSNAPPENRVIFRNERRTRRRGTARHQERGCGYQVIGVSPEETEASIDVLFDR